MTLKILAFIAVLLIGSYLKVTVDRILGIDLLSVYGPWISLWHTVSYTLFGLVLGRVLFWPSKPAEAP